MLFDNHFNEVNHQQEPSDLKAKFIKKGEKTPFAFE